MAVVDGNDILFDVSWGHPPGAICLDVISPWEQHQMIGALEPGLYRVHARLLGHPGCDEEEFEIIGEFVVSDQRFVLDANELTVREGRSANFGVALLAPLGDVEVTAAVLDGDRDVEIVSGATLRFDESNYDRFQRVVVAAAEDADFADGRATIEIRADGFVTARVVVTEIDDDRNDLIYVDRAADGEESGSTWEDAFTDLQDALRFAAEYDDVQEVRVAQGVYRPQPPGGNWNTPFQLVAGVALRGGYAGVRGDDPDERQIRAYETILSGDLDGNDGPGFDGREENSLRVVRAVGLPSTTLLEGFTVTGGDNGSQGGAIDMLGANSDVEVRNCVFVHNRSAYGGAIRIHDSSPLLIDCVFIENETVPGAIHDGGAVYIGGGGDAQIVNCTFVDNVAAEDGGGLCNLSPGTVVTSSLFWNNRDAGGSDETAQVWSELRNGRFDSCLIERWSGMLRGDESFNADPLFRGDGDYHLTADSPCVGAGDPSRVPGVEAVDIDGQPRRVGERVDIGADEFLEEIVSMRRGWINPDETFDLGDPIFLLNYLFAGGRRPTCEKSADLDDNGTLELTDAVVGLTYLFIGGAAPEPPFAACGVDPTDDGLDCALFLMCR